MGLAVHRNLRTIPPRGPVVKTVGDLLRTGAEEIKQMLGFHDVQRC